MKKLLFLFLALLAIQGIAGNVTVPANTNYLVGTSAPYNAVGPGDTLFFTHGNYDYIYVKNFTGTALHPIIFMNKGGQVIIHTNFTYGIKVGGCTFCRFTGIGTIGTFYGFNVSKSSGGAGMSVGDLSSDVEVDHIRIDSTALAGLFYKTDPACGGYAYRSNFTQYNTVIHDCWLGHTTNEGMYVGNTHYTGWGVTCSGNDSILWPSVLIHVRIYNNIVDHAGWDGIQVSSATQDCRIYNNLVLYAGTSDTPSQNAGFMIGGGDSCFVYGNTAFRCKEDGMDVFAFAGNIFNNEIWYPDYGGSQSSAHGIYVGDVSGSPTGYAINFINDLIVSPKSYGIDFNSTASVGNVIENNVVLNPGSGYIETSTSNTIQRNNYENASIATAQFTDTLGNFQVTSPLKDAGYSASFIMTDYLGNPRVSGSAIDIGPVEYQVGSPPVVVIPTINTTSATSITQTTASGGGNVTSDGGATVTAKGVCWSTSASPTISNSHTTDGTGTGTYSSSLTGLTVSTLYYLRAYATNSAGTAYGSQVSFTTSASTISYSISGTTVQHPNLKNQIYFITPLTGLSTYIWSVPSGWVITKGKYSSSVTVTTGAVNQNGNVTCITNAGTFTFPVTVNSFTCQCPPLSH